MKLFELAATLSLNTSDFDKNVKQAMTDSQQLASTLSQKTNPEVEDFGDKMGEASDQSSSLSKGIKKTTEESSKFEKVLRTIGKVLTAKFVIGTLSDIGKTLFATAEQSREYRTEMSKLATAFEVNNLPADTARQTYEGLYAVLGDVDRAVETSGHIAAMAKQYEDLTDWVTICTGVFATFGDSLPVEGLAEAANETAKTGEVTGLLADALNWAGVEEEAFQKKLEEANSERERSKLITETLTSLYGDAAASFRENNAAIIESNQAQEQLRSALADIGEAMEPVVTKVTQLGTRLVTWVTPAVQWLASGLAWLAEKTGEAMDAVYEFFTVSVPAGWNAMVSGVASIWDSVSSSIQTAINKLREFFGLSSGGVSKAASDVGAAVTEATGSELAGELSKTIVQSSTVNPDSNYGGALQGIINMFTGKAVGMDYVPYNDYLARLHEGEAVLTKAEATAWRRGDNQGVIGLNLDALAERIEESMSQRPIAINIDGKAFATIMAKEMSRSIGNRNIQTLMGMGG